jgi:hypothetical protein
MATYGHSRPASALGRTCGESCWPRSVHGHMAVHTRLLARVRLRCGGYGLNARTRLGGERGCANSARGPEAIARHREHIDRLAGGVRWW